MRKVAKWKYISHSRDIPENKSTERGLILKIENRGYSEDNYVVVGSVS